MAPQLTDDERTNLEGLCDLRVPVLSKSSGPVPPCLKAAVEHAFLLRDDPSEAISQLQSLRDSVTIARAQPADDVSQPNVKVPAKPCVDVALQETIEEAAAVLRGAEPLASMVARGQFPSESAFIRSCYVNGAKAMMRSVRSPEQFHVQSILCHACGVSVNQLETTLLSNPSTILSRLKGNDAVKVSTELLHVRRLIRQLIMDGLGHVDGGGEDQAPTIELVRKLGVEWPPFADLPMAVHDSSVYEPAVTQMPPLQLMATAARLLGVAQLHGTEHFCRCPRCHRGNVPYATLQCGECMWSVDGALKQHSLVHHAFILHQVTANIRRLVCGNKSMERLYERLFHSKEGIAEVVVLAYRAGVVLVERGVDALLRCLSLKTMKLLMLQCGIGEKGALEAAFLRNAFCLWAVVGPAVKRCILDELGVKEFRPMPELLLLIALRSCTANGVACAAAFYGSVESIAIRKLAKLCDALLLVNSGETEEGACEVVDGWDDAATMESFYDFIVSHTVLLFFTAVSREIATE